MGRLKRTLLLSFRTKVIVPVVAVMVLLMATSMWLVNQRVTRQLETDAAKQLAADDALLRYVLQLRMDSLLATYRKAENEPRFKALSALFDPEQPLSDTAQLTIRDYLEKRLQENYADAISLIPLHGPALTPPPGETWIKTAEFEAASARLAASAATNGAVVDVARNGDELLDLVAVPIYVQNAPMGTIVFGVRDRVTEDIRKLARSEVILLVDGQVLASTSRERQLETLLSDQVARTAASSRSRVEKTELNDEQYLSFTGTFRQPGQSKGLSYLILSSYEKPLQVMRETQRLILLVSVAAIAIGMAIVWIYVRRVTEPLEELREFTEAIGQGDFNRRLDLNSHDEFGDLAQAFNQMTENLKQSRAQLELTVDSLKSTQAQLVQSEKLSGIGEFVAGVAHELNNPLTSVMGFSELLVQADSDPQHKRYLDMIHKSAQRCQKIVQSLLSFARRHKPERKAVCVNKLIEAALDILNYQLRTSNIEVTSALAPQLPLAMVDPHQMQQVFLNIINNARQAIEGHQLGGWIRITTATRGANVCVTVQDSGPGIPEQSLRKIFDPFFTTKEVGKGTGLGLSLCYGIVKEHGGRIIPRSKLGEGATFEIELPITHEARETPDPKPPPPETEVINPREGAGKKVLVIDDEEPILHMVREALSCRGYHVDLASDGESGLKCLNQKRYDVTLCDWKMPGLSGQEVFERVRLKDRAQAERIIFITGDVVNEKTRRFLEEQKRICLPKPFTLAEFREAIVRMLTSS